MLRNQLLSVGVQARVQDPLWLLGRQWQFGEFQGEDAGSPVQADVRVESTPLTAYAPSIPAAGAKIVGRIYARDPVTRAPVAPLEPLVEAERVPTRDRPRVREAAEAGVRLIRMLVDAGFARYRAAFLKVFAFNGVLDGNADPASALFQRIVVGRSVDAVALAQQLRKDNPPGSTKPFVLPATVGVSVADRPLMATILKHWLDWYEAGLITEPAGATPWTPERMEYRFAVAAPAMAGEQEAVLVAPSYGGDLDWHSFDRLSGSSGTSLGASGAAQVSPTATLIPARVRYPGMPSSRFWEFEDARVDLGAVQVEAGDLARLLLLEFSLAYSNDWFMVPVEVVTGTIARVTALEVVDTFGQRRTIPAAAEGDPGKRSRLFRLSTPGTDLTSDALLVPPRLGSSLESAAVEQVRFARDENANLVWAIERTVESPVGRPLESPARSTSQAEPGRRRQRRREISVDVSAAEQLAAARVVGSVGTAAAQTRARRGTRRRRRRNAGAPWPRDSYQSVPCGGGSPTRRSRRRAHLSLRTLGRWLDARLGSAPPASGVRGGVECPAVRLPGGGGVTSCPAHGIRTRR